MFFVGIASIYHPVGIPMLVRSSTRPGFTIGVNGLAGNLGIAAGRVPRPVMVAAAPMPAAGK